MRWAQGHPALPWTGWLMWPKWLLAAGPHVSRVDHPQTERMALVNHFVFTFSLWNFLDSTSSELMDRSWTYQLSQTETEHGESEYSYPYACINHPDPLHLKCQRINPCSCTQYFNCFPFYFDGLSLSCALLSHLFSVFSASTSAFSLHSHHTSSFPFPSLVDDLGAEAITFVELRGYSIPMLFLRGSIWYFLGNNFSLP